MQEKLDIIIPVSIDLDWPKEQQVADEIIEQYKKYGFTRFALAAPCGGWRSIGYPPREFYTKTAQLFKGVREKVAKYGCECGWWITLTLKSGKTEGFQSMVKADGSEHPIANCPLCDDFRERFSSDVAHFANIANPAFIITEDDFSLSAAEGCYCDLHINEFNKRYGYNYTREQLTEIITSETEEGFKVLRKWRELSKYSLVQFATAIRTEVDKLNPEIPIGYMQAGTADDDGDCTIAVSQALAGKNHTPFSRIYGAEYSGIKAKNIPAMLYHSLYSKQHINCDFKYYLEADTFPHTRFYTASCQMISTMATVFSYGFDGATFQTQQLLDDANEEPGYGMAYAKARASFHTLKDTVTGCKLKGVKIGYDPFWRQYYGWGAPHWVYPVGRFGIPYTTLDSDVAFYDTVWASYAEKEDIMSALSKTIFIDSSAAKKLVERGFGEYLGIKVGEDVSQVGTRKWDLGAREVIKDEFCKTRGKHITSPWMFTTVSPGVLNEIIITDPECEIISELYSYQKEYISPAMVRYKNKLGGKVIVMGLTIAKNFSQSVYNYRRKKLLQTLLINECDKFVQVLDAPNVMIVENVAQDPKQKGFRELLTIINLCEDTLDELKLHLPTDLRDVKGVEILDKNGEWQALDYSIKEDVLLIEKELNYCSPTFLKLK